jgi:hypothetical protein
MKSQCGDPRLRKKPGHASCPPFDDLSYMVIQPISKDRFFSEKLYVPTLALSVPSGFFHHFQTETIATLFFFQKTKTRIRNVLSDFVRPQNLSQLGTSQKNHDYRN